MVGQRVQKTLGNLPNYPNYPDTEASLDIQYIMGIGAFAPTYSYNYKYVRDFSNANLPIDGVGCAGLRITTRSRSSSTTSLIWPMTPSPLWFIPCMTVYLGREYIQHLTFPRMQLVWRVRR